MIKIREKWKGSEEYFYIFNNILITIQNNITKNLELDN